ncbi:MAG: LLM class flavin-dependent oxidoreductase [Thermoleophilia bacterium]
MSLEFGVNLNNREPLIAPDYDLGMLLALSERAEELGFDSVWVGDSLFSKPRYEPIALLSAISQRTERVSLGTACMVSSTRNLLTRARVGHARPPPTAAPSSAPARAILKRASAARPRWVGLRQADGDLRGGSRRHPPALDDGQGQPPG